MASRKRLALQLLESGSGVMRHQLSCTAALPNFGFGAFGRTRKGLNFVRSAVSGGGVNSEPLNRMQWQRKTVGNFRKVTHLTLLPVRTLGDVATSPFNKSSSLPPNASHARCTAAFASSTTKSLLFPYFIVVYALLRMLQFGGSFSYRP